MDERRRAWLAERRAIVRADVDRRWVRVAIVGLFLVACGSTGEQATVPGPSASSVPSARAAEPVAPTTTVGPTIAVATTATVAPSADPTPVPSVRAWSLVAVGDSLPFNSPADCPGCTGYVDRYAALILKATGHRVKIRNLSQHNGLQTDGLLRELESDQERRSALRGADIIVVSIGFNDAPWGRADDPCDGAFPLADPIDWSRYDAECAVASAEVFRPKLERVFALIRELRAGKPTMIRTTNRYNDWIGWSESPPEATERSREVVDAWSAVMCEAAEVHDVPCADIYHAFNGPDGLTPSADLLVGDYTHPSDKGNERIARVLAGLGYAPLWP
jgi:lysophospholipase L1-like esterase